MESSQFICYVNDIVGLSHDIIMKKLSIYFIILMDVFWSDVKTLSLYPPSGDTSGSVAALPSCREHVL